MLRRLLPTTPTRNNRQQIIFLGLHIRLFTASTSSNLNQKTTESTMNRTSGITEPVWLATAPYSSYPKFQKLDKDIDTDVLVVGAGMTGISTAYELVKKGFKTTLIDARNILSGETGRTSGHLSSALDDRYYEIKKTFGTEKARLAYESHDWALKHIGEIAKELNIECEYRTLPGHVIVNVPKTDPSYSKNDDLGKEWTALEEIGKGNKATLELDGTVGLAYEGAILKFSEQATYHPTKYLIGVLNSMPSDRFQCFTNTRMRSYKESKDHVEIATEGGLPGGASGAKPLSDEKGHAIKAKYLVMATNVPINAINIIVKSAYYRTYCVALAMPKDTYPDVLLYDNDDPYVYVKKTSHPDDTKEYLIVGGEDHKVGMETTEGYSSHFDKLVAWAKAHFPKVADKPDYAWSGQIIEPNDYMAYIGVNPGSSHKRVLVCTGDSGNGLTHGVIASRMFTDIISGAENPWAKLYDPSRKPGISTVGEVITENVEQQASYARYVFSDAADIEDIPRCSGAVVKGKLTENLKKPLAVYVDEHGTKTEFSAVCPHAGGVVAWNAAEKTWDCPVHGSRFDGVTGKCVFGPSNRGLSAKNDEAKLMVEQETSG